MKKTARIVKSPPPSSSCSSPSSSSSSCFNKYLEGAGGGKSAGSARLDACAKTENHNQGTCFSSVLCYFNENASKLFRKNKTLTRTSAPATDEGERRDSHLRWRLIGRGILKMTPGRKTTKRCRGDVMRGRQGGLQSDRGEYSKRNNCRPGVALLPFENY